MLRTQIQLTEEQVKALRRVSLSTGLSMAELIRQGVELYLSRSSVASYQERVERALRISGKFASGVSDGSAHHDKYLAEAFKA